MADSSTALDTTPHRPINLKPFGVGALVFGMLFLGGNMLGGEVGSFMTSSTNAVPFAILAVFAYMGSRGPNWAWFATGFWLIVMIGATALASLGLSLSALAGGVMSDQSTAVMMPGDWLRIGVLVLMLLVSIGVGAVLLLPPVRHWLARFIPLDPDSFVHTIALVTVVTFSLLCTAPLLVLGAPPLLALVSDLTLDQAGRGDAGMLRDQLYGLIWIIPAAILAVGFGITRDLRASLLRLGLVRPSVRQIALGIGVALLLAGAVQLLGAAIDWLWGVFGWPVTDTEAFSELLAFALNPLGAVVIGVSAGLGEELAVRGVLQPRMGLVLSNVFFTGLHAWQYSWDALLIVFLVGMACGVVRMRTNTSTAAIVHGVYNFTLVMLSLIPALQ